ncbi:hypothetical protein K7G98_23010 [Saccharothrix sp. MB29]|nr:hypothetical protein [Saccharothrix sp. MB29]
MSVRGGRPWCRGGWAPPSPVFPPPRWGTTSCSTPISATQRNSRPFMPCMVLTWTSGWSRSASRACRTTSPVRAATPIAEGSTPLPSQAFTRPTTADSSASRLVKPCTSGRRPCIGER